MPTATDLQRGQVWLDVDGDAADTPKVSIERIPEGVRGVGRHHQRLDARPRRSDRRGRGRGCLADTTLAREEQYPRVQRDSTRFLSSFRAVSMMTRSALRLSIPSTGIFKSTSRLYSTSVPASLAVSV